MHTGKTKEKRIKNSVTSCILQGHATKNVSAYDKGDYVKANTYRLIFSDRLAKYLSGRQF